ncbi:hypothetical protein PG994_003565 [Apiospora phragmitis]|uniref:Uncharacterized protein n=1 Tax=Apiospora phragmitis TaxID=2905665 RepID=A0ABR1W2C2_9PEZI
MSRDSDYLAPPPDPQPHTLARRKALKKIKVRLDTRLPKDPKYLREPEPPKPPKQPWQPKPPKDPDTSNRSLRRRMQDWRARRRKKKTGGKEQEGTVDPQTNAASCPTPQGMPLWSASAQRLPTPPSLAARPSSANNLSRVRLKMIGTRPVARKKSNPKT